MPVLRRKRRKDAAFVVIHKTESENRKLSWGARGLLAYLLGKPDGWDFNVKHLVTQSPGTMYELKKLLKQLRQAGYLSIVKKRDKAGQVKGSFYIIHEEPKDRKKSEENTAHREVEIHPPGDGHREAYIPSVGISASLVRNDSVVNNDLAHNNINIPPPLSSTPRARNGGVGEGVLDLSFLPEKDRIYSDDIRRQILAYPADAIDQAYIHILRGDHRGATPTGALIKLRDTYGHPQLIAALVYAKSEGDGRGGSLKFLEGILKRWKRHSNTEANTRPETRYWQPAKEVLPWE